MSKHLEKPENKGQLVCKICGHKSLELWDHTAKCGSCGALLFYPYLDDDSLEIDTEKVSIEKRKENWFFWYKRASKLNHKNFSSMFFFTIPEPEEFFDRKIRVLDYGGGGGQFAFVVRSVLPLAEVYIVDINDHALIEQYSPLNRQIKWKDFEGDETLFDFIFLNDVFEHVNDPEGVLKNLSKKLAPGGKLFIDTPKQFWLYPVLRRVNKGLYSKLLKGTVSRAHLQIWTKKSFAYVVDEAGLKLEKYEELSEFTLKPHVYLDKMGIKNRLTLWLGNKFYENAKLLAKNKIQALVIRK
jgi:2-polyprenyl-3-methyl-5-hydroxy-6-metoxy-1,4-benzoquinol methylase